MSYLVNIDDAISKIREGSVLGMPTETVYGLAGRIDRRETIENIFKTKGRPFFDPLIVHVSDMDQARQVAEFGLISETLAKHFWPGPLTLVLPKRSLVSELITSGLQAVGVRMPRHPLALELIAAVGIPLAAPSANKFGKTSPSEAAHVLQEFQQDNVPVLDGGPCHIGIESTVLLVDESRGAISVLRPGYITETMINEFLHEAQVPHQFHAVENKSAAPGQLKHHYMPQIPLILVLKEYLIQDELMSQIQDIIRKAPDEVEGVRLVKPTQTVTNLVEIKLPKDPVLAARQLYSNLRSVAESGADAMYFHKTEDHSGELWESIFERLTKASTGIIRE
jgi:L-threonylcarbamoyladenylate synthase